MQRTIALAWGAAIIMVALLNVVEVLPDWATLTAILTLPFASAVTNRRGSC